MGLAISKMAYPGHQQLIIRSPPNSPDSDTRPVSRKLFSPSGQYSSMQDMQQAALTEDGSILSSVSPERTADGQLQWPVDHTSDEIYLSPLKFVGSTDPAALDLHQLYSLAGCKLDEDVVEDIGREFAKKHRSWLRWMLPGNAPCIKVGEVSTAELAAIMSRSVTVV